MATIGDLDNILNEGFFKKKKRVLKDGAPSDIKKMVNDIIDYGDNLLSKKYYKNIKSFVGKLDDDDEDLSKDIKNKKELYVWLFYLKPGYDEDNNIYYYEKFGEFAGDVMYYAEKKYGKEFVDLNNLDNRVLMTTNIYNTVKESTNFQSENEYLNEGLGLFKYKTQYKYEEPSVDREKSIDKAYSICNKILNKSKYKLFKNAYKKIDNEFDEDYMKEYINGKRNYYTIYDRDEDAFYKYDDDKILDIWKELTDEIDDKFKNICKYSDGSPVYYEFECHETDISIKCNSKKIKVKVDRKTGEDIKESVTVGDIDGWIF